MSKGYKTLKEIELDLVVKSGLIQQLKLKNNQLEERINKATEYINSIKEKWINESVPERNLYMFQTYLDGIDILVHVNYILKGVDKE